MILGYARVSTDGQSLDAQVKQLRRALDQLAKGDMLMVTCSRRFRRRQQVFTPERWKIFSGFVRFEHPIGQNCFT
jgi:DNA invertase Pin-like site-specific DNA recombinase